jgi:hypothetical protein
MYKLYIQLFLLFHVTSICYSQTDNNFPAPDKSGLPDARFQAPRTFSGASLFGYIDGGAELYLEYGFSAAWVTEISFMGGKYKTEIYRMNGPEEAFGIFSVSRYRCKSIPAFTPFACQTKYQLQICSGPYYISIINSSGNKTDSIASLRIGESIVRKIVDPSIDLSAYFHEIKVETIKSNVILAKGKLGLMNGAPDWENYFTDVSGYSVVILPGKDRTILSVKFKDEADVAKFALIHDWKIQDITSGQFTSPGGETVRKLSDHHLYIEIFK